MRLVKIFVVAVGLPLLLSGCSAKYTMKGPEKEAKEVTINNCQADPDTIRVHKDADFDWGVPQTDSHTYTVTFKGRTPISVSSVTVSATQKDNPHKAKGDLLCSVLGSCKFPYTLTQGNGTTCPDPGVHVIP
jgi:PBP1b-binding outer membrane lipoprotein LpoB